MQASITIEEVNARIASYKASLQAVADSQAALVGQMEKRVVELEAKIAALTEENEKLKAPKPAPEKPFGRKPKENKDEQSKVG